MAPMKILLLIDHFGSGGAQRQIVTLGKLLERKGYAVEFFIYYPNFRFYQQEIETAGIKINSVYKRNLLSNLEIIWKLRNLLKAGKFNILISFLDGPNIYAEIASIGIKNLKVIVSERNSYLREGDKLKSLFKRLLHLFATSVITNSKSQNNWICDTYPFLKNRIKTIYNGYDPKSIHFSPLENIEKKSLKLIGIGRIAFQKNQLSLIHALDIFYRKNGWCPSITWVGNLHTSAEPEYKAKVFNLLDSLPAVKRSWSWLGERSDVPDLLRKHHALILPSYFEGLPNVVCEAFFSGRPVLVSNVCDHPLLVGKNSRGFLFDPHDPRSIADSIECFSDIRDEQRIKLSIQSRRYAEDFLNVDRMVNAYEKLFKNA